MTDVSRLFARVGMSHVKARRAARLLIHWHRQGLVTDCARHLSCALSHQSSMLDRVSRGQCAETSGVRRDLALVAFYSSLASDRRSGHQETTQ